MSKTHNDIQFGKEAMTMLVACWYMATLFKVQPHGENVPGHDQQNWRLGHELTEDDHRNIIKHIYLGLQL